MKLQKRQTLMQALSALRCYSGQAVCFLAEVSACKIPVL